MSNCATEDFDPLSWMFFCAATYSPVDLARKLLTGPEISSVEKPQRLPAMVKGLPFPLPCHYRCSVPKRQLNSKDASEQHTWASAMANSYVSVAGFSYSPVSHLDSSSGEWYVASEVEPFLPNFAHQPHVAITGTLDDFVEGSTRTGK